MSYPVVAVNCENEEICSNIVNQLLAKLDKNYVGCSTPQKKCEVEIITKYYKATIYIEVVNGLKDLGSAPHSYEGLIYYEEKISDQNIGHIEKYLSNSSVSVKILACSQLEERYFDKIMKVCIDNDTELVDLNSPEDENDEKQGVDRIAEILETHNWPNSITLKNSLNDDNQEPVPFEELFAKFAVMKATADKLEPSQRKAFAESVVAAFWTAAGGPEDELYSCDEDSD
ncbi:alpha- and gamma-adaptin-binding protein p34-like [Artemia franciscana]|uniref:Alpha-and gamma-adaptin-binding protein p34 n=1 Tax=Artemia franciscana TaxID=6661 RepID=A0AA88IAZ4_ARTSF|nr:hypothetical protein QYM36_000394 [Artemia franciscana]KAK2725904.1 hypothetical protein QYM36_000394 [Artemia franciscana]